MSQVQLDSRLLLKQILVKEKMLGLDYFGRMVAIPGDFYKTQKQFLSDLTGQDKIEMTAMYNTLIVSRKTKLVSYAEALIPIDQINDTLADEEKIFYANLLKITTEFSDLVKL